MQIENETFIKNLDKELGVNYISYSPDIIRERINKYFQFVVGDNLIKILGNKLKPEESYLKYDFLLGGNRSEDIDLLINSKKNNDLVKKFNRLINQINMNLNYTFYQTCDRGSKYLFQAFLINRLLNMSDIINKAFEDNYKSYVLANFGMMKGINLEKFLSEKNYDDEITIKKLLNIYEEVALPINKSNCLIS